MTSFGRFFADVVEFHREMGFFPFIDSDPKSGIEVPLFDDRGRQIGIRKTTLDQAVMRKRCDIVREEAEEFCEALADGDKSKILHEGIDLIYVALGGLIESGVTWAELSVGWSLVQIANLGKDKPSSPLSKAIKGDRFEAADVSKALGAEGEVHSYAVVCGEGESARAMMVNTIGPMDRSDWLALVRDAVTETGRLPTMIRELL